MKLNLQTALLILAASFTSQPAIAQETTIPSGTYVADNRYISIASNGERTCYQGFSIPSLENSITVGETTGSLAAHQAGLLAEGWFEYGREVVFDLKESMITVLHEGYPAGDYAFYSPELINSDHVDALTRCLNSPQLFFETLPGYVVTRPRIQSPEALAAASSSAPSTPLPSGLYYAQGTMNNNSRREILNSNGQLCIKIIEGPPSPYGGRENVTVSSISDVNGELYIDATGSTFAIYQGQALDTVYASPQTTVAFNDGSRRGVWERNNQLSAAQVGAALEQDEYMRACIESTEPYVHEMEGAVIYGIDF